MPPVFTGGSRRGVGGEATESKDKRHFLFKYIKMDTIGLYIHIHLTKPGEKREEEDYLKCLIDKYCNKKKIASITLLSKYQLSCRSPKFVFIIGLGGRFRLSIQSVIKINWNCS